MEYLMVYLAVVNLVSVVFCVVDKISAKIGGQRISEKTLISLSVLGGALFMYITMRIIKHKTRHNKFMLGLPLIILFQMAILVLFYMKIL